MSQKITVGIHGISGNGGGELFRYISQHPNFELTCVFGEGSVGKTLSELFPGLFLHGGIPDLKVEAWDVGRAVTRAALIFMSLPTGKSKEVAAQIPESVRVIDLGGNHRFIDGWSYSIPEFTWKELREVKRVANPGCYPTAIMLALAPLLNGPQLCGYKPGSVIINANSGLSGMGRGSKEAPSFADLNEDAWTYKVTGHPHLSEIESAIRFLTNSLTKVVFIPQCVPMSRGISAVCVLDGDIKGADLIDVATKYYEGSPFVRVVKVPPHTKWASGTNMAYLSYVFDPKSNAVIALSAIDNLGKGAAGQAIQNANLMFGLPEDAGLAVTPVWP